METDHLKAVIIKVTKDGLPSLLKSASLEDAFFWLTAEAVEYRGTRRRRQRHGHGRRGSR